MLGGNPKTPARSKTLEFEIVGKRVRGRRGEMPSGSFVSRMAQVRFEPRAIVEFEDRGVLIIHVHRLLVPGEAVQDASAETKRANRRDVRGRVLKIREYLPLLGVSQSFSRFEEDDVHDQR